MVSTGSPAAGPPDAPPTQTGHATPPTQTSHATPPTQTGQAVPLAEGQLAGSTHPRAQPPARGRRAWLRWLVAVPAPLVLIGLVALCGVVLNRIYHGPLLAQLVLGAAAGAVAVSTALRRAPAWSVAPVSVLAMTGYVALAVRISATRAAVPGGLVEVASDALRNGIPRLLNTMIPMEPQPDTVVVPVIAAWLAALTAAEVSLRAGRMLLGYLPSALLYAGALYVVGPNAPTAVRPTLAYMVLAALGLAFTGRPAPARLPASGQPGGALAGGGQSHGSTGDLRSGLDEAAHAAIRLRLAAGTAAAMALVVALGAVLGPAVAEQVTTRPVDPRRYVPPPPQLDTLDENPLIRISGWALSPEQHLFDARLTGPAGTADGAADRRIRLAVLSDYDGVTWRVGAKYRSAGRALPPPPAAGGAPAQTTRQDIAIADLSGRLLPAAATPVFVDGVRVAYDPVTGTLIRPDGLLPGVRYTVESTAQPLEVNLLASAGVPSGPAVARLLDLGPSVPEQIGRLARQLGSDSGAPYDRALAIEQFLAEHYRLVTDAPSGHAYPNLSFFLFGPRNGGGQRGTSEQFAASYAVLARLLGLPARVVVGFRVPPGGGPVRAADALAWPEVLFDEVGWVPFNPLPQPKTQPRPVEEDFRPEPEPSTPPPSDAPTLTAGPSRPPATTPAAAQAPAGGLSSAAVAAVALAVLVLAMAGYAGTVPSLVRARRRRRLSDPDPARRVAGAWLEVIDALRLAGRPAPAHLTATEVVAYAHAVLAAPPLDALADLVNLTAFGGLGPVREPAGSTAQDRVDEAGRDAMEYVRGLRSRQPWWRRVLWSLHPGPLRWHR